GERERERERESEGERERGSEKVRETRGTDRKRERFKKCKLRNGESDVLNGCKFSQPTIHLGTHQKPTKAYKFLLHPRTHTNTHTQNPHTQTHTHKHTHT